ncbi:MAG: tRNA (N6-isopentenyl adenosine(37)-C2)-methylthiotransferase MiaB [Bacilli bacterium]
MKTPNLNDARLREKTKINIIDSSNIKIPQIGIGKTYNIRTYGCQMNVHDSEKISAILETMGYKKEDNYLKADIIILNTCAVRENAHNKVFGFLGRIKHLKRDRPDILVGLCGCMSQEEVVVEEVLNKYAWLDIVFGTHNIQNLPKLLLNSIEERKIEVEVLSNSSDIVENLPIKRDSKYKAFVNIMYGCDKFCTYCIVPYTRGKQRSRRKEDILNEIQKLKNDGYKEITLLGQNVNSYGKDFENSNYRFENLLEDSAKIGIERIFFVTSHPWDFTDSMIDIIAKYENVCPFIHLPVQSGSTKILRTMGRRYSKEDYLTLVSKIRKKIPSATISTDIIVGFPNETKEDFEETLSVVNICKYDLAYTFIYSKREGTPAAKIDDNIPLEIKEERLQKLNMLVNNYAKENNEKLIGQTLSVLLEGVSTKHKNMLYGHSSTMKNVNVFCDESLLGQIVNVKITNAKSFNLEGELISE